MIFYLQNNNKFLVSIFPSKSRFTSIPWSKLNDNSLELFPPLSLIKLALFEKLLDRQHLPLFKELLDVADPGITNWGFSTTVDVNQSSSSTLISGVATKR